MDVGWSLKLSSLARLHGCWVTGGKVAWCWVHFVTESLMRNSVEFNRRLHVTKFSSLFVFLGYSYLFFHCLWSILKSIFFYVLSFFWKVHLSARFTVSAHSSKQCSCLWGYTIKKLSLSGACYSGCKAIAPCNLFFSHYVGRS